MVTLTSKRRDSVNVAIRVLDLGCLHVCMVVLCGGFLSSLTRLSLRKTAWRKVVDHTSALYIIVLCVAVHNLNFCLTICLYLNVEQVFAGPNCRRVLICCATCVSRSRKLCKSVSFHSDRFYDRVPVPAPITDSNVALCFW